MLLSKMAGKLYMIMNFQKFVDEQDPDYSYVFKLLEDIEKQGGDLSEFYTHLHAPRNGESKFFAKSGALIRGSLNVAAEEFMSKIKKDQIDSSGVKEKAKELFTKIYMFHATLKSTGKDKDFFVSKLSDQDFLRNVKKTLHKGTPVSLFSEKDIITISKTDKSELYQFLEEHKEFEAEDIIRNAYYLTEKEKALVVSKTVRDVSL